MLMSAVSYADTAEIHPELAGARVLITGLTPAAGVDLARGFADHKAQLILQADLEAPEITELGVLLAQTATEIRLFTAPIAPGDEAVRFAQTAAQAFGGLDVAVNIVTVGRGELAGVASEADIEALVSRKLGAALEMTRVLANRMRLTLGTGLILNVVVAAPPAADAEAALISVIRAALAAMTRVEAGNWAGQDIRINAVGPRASLPGDPPSAVCLTSEPDIAALALYLASRKGRQLTGHVFDAERVASRGC